MRLFSFVFVLLFVGSSFADAPKRFNIVFIGAEDISPNLGCYGDKYAITPNLDKFASQGARFTRCFTHAPVCAPSRSGLITGMYPTSIGSHHMRSTLLKPPITFTEELRNAGYFVAWPGKTDFNFAVPKGAFDTTANWMNKDVLKEPFFAYINFTVTHESQVRAAPGAYQKNTARLKESERHDPTKAPIPPYYPDAPEVRKNIATYYDNITGLDYLVGDVLKWLEDKKLADNTLVIFFGDHGWGMSRGKRWVYDSGIRAPLLVRWPGKIKPGTVREDLVAFVDLAPTILTAAGAKVPERMQGRSFLGEGVKERNYVYAARDRMDETFDRIRAVRDKRFKYIRNYYPELPYAQTILYMDEMPTMKVWRQWNAEGKLTGPQKNFFAATKPKEELYDCNNDPHEVSNLADDPKHVEKLNELRGALDKWVRDTKDLGEVHEDELIRRGLVVDRISTEYAERIKNHPQGSKASTLPPKE
jgi:uncharacterized sulfatase